MRSHIHHLVAVMAYKRPNQTAVIDSDRIITYRELDIEISDVTARLVKGGLNKGERVGIISRNSIEFVAVLFGVSRAGGIPVLLNYSLKPSGIAEQAKNCLISALYLGKGMEAVGREINRKVRSIRFMISEADIKNRLPYFFCGPKVNREKKVCRYPSGLAVIIYTSGTASGPMGVMLSHKNLISNSESIVKYLRIAPSDIACCVLPFHYIFGLSVLLSHFLAGATVLLDNRFMYPNLVLDSMDKYKVTTFAGVSSHYALLINSSDIAERKMPSLKRFLQAGDRIPERITRRLHDIFPRKKLYMMYGLTEASPRLTYLDPKLSLKKPGSVGKAIPGVKIKVVSRTGEVCRIGEEGEIIAKGDNIMLGYWRQRARTRDFIKRGWLHTGDIGYKDADGDLFLTGRKKDFIKIGGNKVNLREVEDEVSRFEGVMKAVAFGIDDKLMGKRVRLYVEPVRGIKITEGDIMKFCKRNLSSHEMPVKATIMKSMSKNIIKKT